MCYVCVINKYPKAKLALNFDFVESASLAQLAGFRELQPLQVVPAWLQRYLWWNGKQDVQGSCQKGHVNTV